MTRSQLRNLVLEATGRNDKTSLINSSLDMAVQEVSSAHLWSDLLVAGATLLVEGATSTALASDVSRLSEIRVIEDAGTPGWPLELRQKTWLVSHFPDYTARSAGRPTYGFLEGINLSTIPVPDQDYNLAYSYYRLHPTLPDDSSVTLIRLADKAIIAYAIFWTFQSLERGEEAKRWFEIYQTALLSAKKLDRGNSAVKNPATQRGEEPLNNSQYWLNPLIRSMP